MSWEVWQRIRKMKRDLDEKAKIQNFFNKYDPTIPLHYAVAHNVIKLARSIVNAGYNINFQDYEGTTPLILAVSHINNVSMEMIRFLIEAGADIFVIDVKNKNAIEIVFDQRTNSKHEVVEFFLDRVKYLCGNNIDSMAKMLIDANCPLEYVVLIKNAELTKYMLTKYHYVVDARNPLNNRTALHSAVENMDFENIKMLVEHGADVNAKDSKNQVPLFYYSTAVDHKRQNLEIIRFLMDRDAILTDSNTISEYMSIAPLFMEGSREVIQLLLQYDIDFTAEDDYMRKPLHYLSMNVNPHVTEDLENVNFNVDALDYWKYTPLMYAVTACNQSTIRFLLEKGANVNHRSHGETPILAPFIVDYEPKMNRKRAHYEACAEILLQHGAELDPVFFYNIEPAEDHLTIFDEASPHIYRNLRRPILAHLAKLEILNKPMNDKIREKINSSSVWKRGLNLYKRELKKMKEIKIHRSINMFTLIEDHEMKFIERYRCHFKIVSKLSRANINFPKSYIYGLLEKRINKTLKTLKTRVIAAGFISKVFNLPSNDHIVIEKIMTYLCYADYKKLVKVYCMLKQ